MAAATTARDPRPMSEHTTHIPATRRLERSRSDRMLVGVCGGLARYFEIHPAVFRVGFVVLALLGGAGLLIYAAAALVMPDEGKEDSITTAALRNRRERPWPLIGLGLVAVAFATLLSQATLWPQGDAWVPLLLAGGAILWITRHSLKPAATVDAGALAAEDSRRMRRAGRTVGIVIGSIIALVLVAAAVFAATFHVHLGNGVGNRTYAVAGVEDLRGDYKLGVGNLKVDLSSVQLPAGETHVNTRVDVGNLRVIVPEDAALRVHGDAQIGEIDLLGSTADGHNVENSIVRPGSRVLVLDAHVGVGSLHVERAVR
jgi:phage shock protein PspC (stress-responsive transcriptional regulator)